MFPCYVDVNLLAIHTFCIEVHRGWIECFTFVPNKRILNHPADCLMLLKSEFCQLLQCQELQLSSDCN